MRICTPASIIAILFSTIATVYSQNSTQLPPCWRNCIDTSGTFNCTAHDTACYCRGWNNGILTATLTCIENNCGNPQNTSTLIGPIEVECGLAGVPILNAEPSSSTAPHNVTVTITASPTSAAAASESTIAVVVTDSLGNTVIEGFTETIGATTVEGSLSVYTPAATQPTPVPTSGGAFGSCNNPGIVYWYGLDGTSGNGFAPADETQFPRTASSDIANIESFICHQLVVACNANALGQLLCDNAFNLYSGLNGQNAADVWNVALGLPKVPLATALISPASTSPSTGQTLSSPSATSTVTISAATTIVNAFTQISASTNQQSVPTSTASSQTTKITDTFSTISAVSDEEVQVASTLITKTVATTAVVTSSSKVSGLVHAQAATPSSIGPIYSWRSMSSSSSSRVPSLMLALFITLLTCLGAIDLFTFLN